MLPTVTPGAGGDPVRPTPAVTARILYVPFVALLLCFVVGALVVPGQLDRIRGAQAAEEHFLLAVSMISSMGTRFGDEDYWPTIKSELDEACQSARLGQRMAERAGRLLAAKGLSREAVPYLVGALDENPSYELATETAQAAAQCGDTVTVTRGYAVALRLRPDSPEPYNSLGYYYAVQDIRLQEAESLVVRAIELATRTNTSALPVYYDSLAWVYYRQGRFLEAWQAMQYVPTDLAEPIIDQHRLAIQRALLDESALREREEGASEGPGTESAPRETESGEGAGP